MKQLQVGDTVYEADKIYREGNRITGVSDSGIVIFEFKGIKNLSDFVLLDGVDFDTVPKGSETLVTAMMGGTEMANENVAGQFRRAIQLFAQTLDEETALEIADLYPPWEPNKAYKSGTIIRHGKNEEGKSQLYAVMQAHNSQADWIPGPAMAALYKAIGFTDTGVAIWVQPQGEHDAYKQNDVVMHNGQKWKSSVNGNVWEPGVYGWTVEP